MTIHTLGEPEIAVELILKFWYHIIYILSGSNTSSRPRIEYRDC